MYKLIGPTLIRQDPVEATSNVQKRLEFITRELSSLDAQLKLHESKAAKRQQQVLDASSLLTRPWSQPYTPVTMQHMPCNDFACLVQVMRIREEVQKLQPPVAA